MNESGNIAPLVDEICTALAGRSFEIIYVDDASNDDSLGELAQTAARVPQLRILRHEARAGQSAAPIGAAGVARQVDRRAGRRWPECAGRLPGA